MPEWLPALLAGLALGLLAGWSLGQLRGARLREEKARLEALLEGERTAAARQIEALRKAEQELADTFRALSGKALRESSESFLQLARTQLEAREQAIGEMLRPIREALEKTERQIREIEKERREAYGALSQHLRAMLESHQALQAETRRLVQALRRPEVRGQWGELTLRRLVELAGMQEHCDFEEQPSVAGEDGRLRPDLVVHLPEARRIVVDAKTPLDAYLEAVEAEDEGARRAALARHARKVRERVQELASKRYWARFDGSLDFVVLFIPGDQFLAAALEQDPALLEDALADRVMLATPTSLVALLRAVAYGWRQQALARNAETVRDLGRELYERLAVMTAHLDKLGAALNRSVGAYNAAVGSLERRVLPSARRFTELGVPATRELGEPKPVESLARSPAAPAGGDDDADAGGRSPEG